jgi:hypothetical protein
MGKVGQPPVVLPDRILQILMVPQLTEGRLLRLLTAIAPTTNTDAMPDMPKIAQLIKTIQTGTGGACQEYAARARSTAK